MTTYTFSDLSWIRREELADLVKSKASGISIIDVRDDDYIGGHIINSQNITVNTHDVRMPELVRTLKDQDVVIFHCTLSQQRGPGSALRYLRERDAMLSKGAVAKREDGKELKDGQEVKVLEGGFSKWQHK